MGAELGGVFYVAGGLAGTAPTSALEAYTPATNAWHTLASMPETGYEGTAAALDGQLYVIGGWQGGLPTASVYAYDPLTNSWSTRAPMPTLSACQASGVVGDKLYVLTACNGFNGYSRLLDVYDPVSNSWTQLTSAPHAHADPAAGVIGGKFYVAGGLDDAGNQSGTLDVYDPLTGSWSTGASMPTPVTQAGSSVLDGKLYVVGGLSGSSPEATVQVYDPLTDTWTRDAAMPFPARGSVAATIGEQIYTAAGTTGSGDSGALEVYTATATTPPSGPTGAGAAAIQLSALSTMMAAPFTTLAISGTGLTGTAAGVSVRFIPENGSPAMTVPVSGGSSTRLLVSVPSLRSGTGGSVSGLVDVQVIQALGTTLRTSNVQRGLRITALPSLPTSTNAGSRTVAFLTAALNGLSSTQTALKTKPGLSSVSSAYSSSRSALETVIADIKQVETHSRTSVSLLTAKGSRVALNSKTLMQSDQLIQAVVAALNTQIKPLVHTAEESVAATSTRSALSPCPSYPNDPRVYDTNLCHVQRFFQNVATNPDVTNLEMKALLGVLVPGIATNVAASGGFIRSPATTVAADLVAGGTWALDDSYLSTGTAPPGSEFAIGMSIAAVDEWAKTQGVLGFTYDVFKVFHAAATVFPPTTGVAPVAMEVSDVSGNTYLVLADGSTLVKVPDGQGSVPIDSTKLVIPPPSPGHSPGPVDFSGTWTGTYSGLIHGNGSCSNTTFPISGRLTLVLSQTRTSLTEKFSVVGAVVHWDVASCIATGYSTENFSISASVSGMVASGNGASMTMHADLTSLSGNRQGPGGKFTFTARRSSRP